MHRILFLSTSFLLSLTLVLLQDVDCMPLNPSENMPASLAKNLVTFDKLFENFNELKMNGWAKDQKQEGHMKIFPGESLEHVDVPCHVSSSTYPMSNLLKQAKVSTYVHMTCNVHWACRRFEFCSMGCFYVSNCTEKNLLSSLSLSCLTSHVCIYGYLMLLN